MGFKYYAHIYHDYNETTEYIYKYEDDPTQEEIKIKRSYVDIINKFKLDGEGVFISGDIINKDKIINTNYFMNKKIIYNGFMTDGQLNILNIVDSINYYLRSINHLYSIHPNYQKFDINKEFIYTCSAKIRAYNALMYKNKPNINKDDYLFKHCKNNQHKIYKLLYDCLKNPSYNFDVLNNQIQIIVNDYDKKIKAQQRAMIYGPRITTI